MNTLIFGASGLVGGNCYKHFSELGYKILSTHFSYPTNYTIQVDTTQRAFLIDPLINNFKPEVLIHTGALTHVDYCETNVEESFLNTVQSTKNILDLAKLHDAIIVFISTDYVFDGNKGLYKEEDITNPLSVYGKHKLEAENIVLGYEKHIILRITNVYGNELRNKNFVSRIVDASKKEIDLHLKLPIDQYATPINAYDVARAIELLLKDKAFGIWHLASTDYFNRYQLAQKVLDYFPSKKISIEDCITKSLNQVAKRPLIGGLLAHKFLCKYPDFKFSNLDDYLKVIHKQNI